MVASQLKPTLAQTEKYAQHINETVVGFVFLVVWVFESFTSSRFLEGYRYAVNIQGQTFSFANPFIAETASPYVYAFCLMVLTALFAYIAYSSGPMNVGLAFIMQCFPLRAWAEVPFEPIGLYVFVSIWIIAATGLALTLIAWRLLRHFGRNARMRAASSADL